MFGGTRGMVIKSLWGVLIAAGAVFSADRTFFFFLLTQKTGLIRRRSLWKIRIGVRHGR